MKNTSYEFITTIRGFINTGIIYIAFSFGNVRRLDINNKSIYLWQNAKGDVYYCFSIFDKEPYSTSITKLGNVLTNHFGCEVEVVNNNKEHLKKLTSATTNLNKALSDSERQSYYTDMNQSNQLQLTQSSDDLDILIDDKVLQSQPYPIANQGNQQNPLHNQEELNKSVIQLSTYYLESHLNTIYIKLTELPIIYKEVYAPYTKQVIFVDDKDLNCKNSYIPTEHMIESYNNYCDLDQSFILKFIFFMVNNNIAEALKILVWIADIFTSLGQLPFALVLYSKDDTYMRLLYDEIVVSLCNIDECEQIENASLDKKSLANKLHQKFIYHFHNITAPTILDEPSYEFTDRLIHKNKQKINNKTIATTGNILITSTTSYIPLISEELPTATVNVCSSLDDLCKEYNIRANKHVLANLIENDLPNFVNIIKCIDLDKLCNDYQVIDCNTNDAHSEIMDGNVDPIEVFDKIIRDMDIVPFISSVTTKKEQKLVDELEDNYAKNMVDKNHLLDYFEILFGIGIYKSNTALIGILRKDYSTTGEPFGDYQTHVREGRGYYFL